eukprot:3749682-Prymnesium_polylepis.1
MLRSARAGQRPPRGAPTHATSLRGEDPPPRPHAGERQRALRAKVAVVTQRGVRREDGTNYPGSQNDKAISHHCGRHVARTAHTPTHRCWGSLPVPHPTPVLSLATADPSHVQAAGDTKCCSMVAPSLTFTSATAASTCMCSSWPSLKSCLLYTSPSPRDAHES